MFYEFFIRSILLCTLILVTLANKESRINISSEASSMDRRDSNLNMRMHLLKMHPFLKHKILSKNMRSLINHNKYIRRKKRFKNNYYVNKNELLNNKSKLYDTAPKVILKRQSCENVVNPPAAWGAAPQGAIPIGQAPPGAPEVMLSIPGAVGPNEMPGMMGPAMGAAMGPAMGPVMGPAMGPAIGPGMDNAMGPAMGPALGPAMDPALSCPPSMSSPMNPAMDPAMGSVSETTMFIPMPETATTIAATETTTKSSSVDPVKGLSPETPLSQEAISDQLSKVLKVVEEFNTNKKLNPVNCSVAGSWVAEMAGRYVDLNFSANGNINVKLRRPVQKDRLGFMGPFVWNASVIKPFAVNNYIILTAVDTKKKQVATFMGECIQCRLKNIIQGQWLIAEHSRDCESRGATNRLVGDVWRKDTLDSKKHKHLDQMNSIKKHNKEKEKAAEAALASNSTTNITSAANGNSSSESTSLGTTAKKGKKTNLTETTGTGESSSSVTSATVKKKKSTDMTETAGTGSSASSVASSTVKQGKISKPLGCGSSSSVASSIVTKGKKDETTIAASTTMTT